MALKAKRMNQSLQTKISRLLHVAFGCCLLLFSACKQETISTQNIDNQPNATFIGTAACQQCHTKEYHNWKGSHHDQAMKLANDTTILGNFNNVTFQDKNEQTKFFRKEDGFYVNTQGPDGKNHDYKIEYTFGVTPLQQYIVKFPKGAYQVLTTAWDSKNNKWFSLQKTPNVQPDDWMHWSRGSMTWNTMCADCHSTELKKNYDPETASYRTSFQEINVNCEACHGPGSLHQTFYQQGAHGKRPRLYMDKSTSSKELVDKCARCHSRREPLTKVFDFKGYFLDNYVPSLLVYPTYEKDGQIRDEDYVYGSFVQSKMYHNGVSCRNCHDMHSLKLIKTGNALCLTCHAPKYNEPSHHFHKKNTKSAQCINCHMTGKYYMTNDFRRDHSFRLPRPDQSVKYGTPNACTGCHKNKSAQWAADFIVKNYGAKRADHFSEYLLAGYNGDEQALSHLAQGQKYPEIARATALSLLSNQPSSQKIVEALKTFLPDSAALMRREAVIGLTKLQAQNTDQDVAPLLADSIRAVRIAAAKYFTMLGLTPKDKTTFAKAEKEYLDYLEMNSDFAYGQQEWALYYQAKGNLEKTIQSYQRALEIDNYYNTSRMNLALIQYQQGHPEIAEKLYLKVIEQEPNFGYAYYMLGLLYNEIGDSSKALHFLAQACEKEPFNPRACYNYALKLQETGKYQKSIQVMDKALSYQPDNEDFLYIKLLAQIKSKQNQAAVKTCKKLLQINPLNEQYQQLLAQLQGQ